MQRSILSLFAVCLAVSLCELMLPGEEASGSKRLLRMLASLCVIVILLSPLKGILETFQNGKLTPTLPESEEGELACYEEIFYDAVERQSAKDLAAGIKLLLAEQYGVREGEAEVLIYLSPDGRPERIRIFLSGTALTVDPGKIEADLAPRLNCTVEVR